VITAVRSHSDTLLKRPILVQAEGRRSTVAVQATVNQLAAYATRTESDVRSTAIGALASVLTRQQARSTPRLWSYSNKTTVRWRNRMLAVLNRRFGFLVVAIRVSLVVARSDRKPGLRLISILTVKSTYKPHSP
jgi:hypothetical protein